MDTKQVDLGWQVNGDKVLFLPIYDNTEYQWTVVRTGLKIGPERGTQDAMRDVMESDSSVCYILRVWPY